MRRRTLLPTLALNLALLLPLPASRADSATAVASPAPAATKATASSKTIWDAWYTVTVGKGSHYAYYNDRVESREGRLFFQNRFWKNEEGYVNEEQLGAFSEDSPELKPLFFNFHSTYRTTETTIDGTVQDGRQLTVKARKGGQELPLGKKSLPPGVILSAFFPVWLGQKLKTLKPDQSATFTGILEDGLESAFAPMPGRIRAAKPDAFATKNQVRKVTVNFRDMDSVWYVDERGIPARIEMPAMKAVVEKVSREKARKFLQTPGS
jgi:hypothetical protein